MKLLKNWKSRLKHGLLFIVLMVLGLFPVHLNNQPTPKELTIPKQEEVKQDSEDLKCLIKIAYNESQGEGDEGIRRTIQVILNRTKDKRFPNTICGVVKEAGAFSGSSRRLKQKIPSWSYRHIKKIAQNAIQKDLEGIDNSLPRKIVFFKRCDTENSFFSTLKFHSRYKNHCYYY